jgi:AsmA-like C-terminal region
MRTQTSGRTRTLPRGAAVATSGTSPSRARWRPRFSFIRNERLANGLVGLLIVIGPVILLSVIAVAIVFVRLQHGPISLNAFNHRIEEGISLELGDLEAKIDDAVVTLTRDRGLEFQLINLRISEPNGDLVASAPLAALELDHSQLFSLRAAPERVFLIEPTVSLLYTEGGGIALSISESQAPDPGRSPPPASGSEVSAGLAPPVPAVASTGEYRIDLARALAEMSRRARRGRDATSSLREVGLRDATVVVRYGGNSGEWKVSEAGVDLQHMKRGSVVSGRARVFSERGPWTFEFRAEDSGGSDGIRLTSSVRELVPSTLSQASPQLSLLETLDMPVSGDISMELSAGGDVREGTVALQLGRGRILLPGQSSVPLVIDYGQFNLGYDAASRRFKLAPSTLRWGDSSMTVEGAMLKAADAGETPQWNFSVNAIEGVFAAEEFGVPGVNVEAFKASGRVVPDQGLVELGEFSLKAGGAEIAVSGHIAAGTSSAGTLVEATMTPMTLPTLKALWPRGVVPAARTWVGKNVTEATLKSGRLKFLSGRYGEGEAPPSNSSGEPARERLSMAIEVGDLQMVPFPKGFPVKASRALIQLENNVLEVTVPEAALVASEKSQVSLSAGRFSIVDVSSAVAIGELEFKTKTELPTLIDVLNRSRLDLLEGMEIPASGLDGMVDGKFKVTMPLGPGGVAGGNAKVSGKARVTRIRLKEKVGPFEVQGGSFDVDVSPTGGAATGEMMLNGVLAKVEFQHIFDVPTDMQPPLRITATLDNADRTQLGLDVNHLVQGEVPLEISLKKAYDDRILIHGRADLTNAELLLHDLAWRKAPGRSAVMEFDVGKSEAGATELQNFKVAGDDIAIEGWLSIDDENEVREFYFPDFSLNVVSRLQVQGKINDARVWSIKATGTTYDARQLFTSFVSLGQAGDREIKPLKPAAGMDFDAQIDTVLGHSDLSMRGFKLKLKERNDVVVGLDAKGTLAGGKPLAVLLRGDGDARQILADSTDAGAAFKLVGFYPNIEGGRARLEVALNARGAADKTGILWVEKFRVLGDPIVSEVYSSVDFANGPAINATPRGRRRVTREVFDFDRMKVPFSVGHGQFVLNEAYVKGAALGASIRGKVDFRTRRVNLGGTYVPLQGINAALCDIPLFGPIVTGFKCEGVFGITYAIQGPMAQPQVIVNPLSMLTPGILRGIMEMTNPNPKVLPRDLRPRGPVKNRVRSSSSSAKSKESGSGSASGSSWADSIDGWSSETTSPRHKGSGAKSKSQKAKP